MTLDLQILTDRIAIEERLNLYAHYIDTGQASRVPSEIFTIEADIMLGGIPVIGREALADMLASMMKAMDGTSHNITNVMIDVRGDEAYAYSRIIGWHWLARPGADSFRPADLTAVGAYQDHFRRTPEGWRIGKRRGMNYGTGIGIGTIGEELKPVFQGMWGRMHEWPVP
jgi:hypothetical protein